MGTRRKSSRPRRNVCSSPDVIETLKLLIAITGLDVIFHCFSVLIWSAVVTIPVNTWLTDSTWMNAERTSWCGCESEAFLWRPKLTRFTNVACIIWPKIDLEYETQRPRLRHWQFFSRRDQNETLVRLETETSRPRSQPCFFYSVGIYW